MITLFRIDDRLIHGQVAMAWSRIAQADVILAVDSRAANDKLQKMALLLAKPSGVDAKIIDPADFSQTYQRLKEQKVMVVVGNPIEAKKILDYPEIDNQLKVNLGNLKSGPNKEKIADAIYVDDAEKKALASIKKKGFKIYIQGTPTSKMTSY